MQSAIDISTQAVSYGRPSTRSWLTGLLIAEITCVLAPVGVLSAYFQFPDILRQPASVALPLFAVNESVVVPAYYVFMLSGLLFLPISVLLRRRLGTSTADPLLNLVVGLGLATALFQSIGFSRWIFAVPFLAHRYQQAAGDVAVQQAISLLYDTLNRYLGMTIGEHLGFITMGAWTICLAQFLRRSGQCPRWFGLAGIAIGVLLILSVGEHAGTSLSTLFGLANFLANTAWTIWLLSLTIRLTRSPT